MGNSPLPQTRRRARHYAMQAIYGWQMAGGSATEIEASFRTEYDFNNTDTDFFREIISAVTANVTGIDQYIAPVIDRDIKELNGVELALLRCAVFELAQRSEVPYKVVINEAIELAKVFAAEDSHKFVNGVLDKAAPHVRKK